MTRKQLRRRDELTDFAEEYCRYLVEALRVHDRFTTRGVPSAGK